MVMEASPTSSLKVPEPELLFEFLVVPLDAPAQLRERDEAVEGDVFRKGRKPELRGLLLLSWPFDEEPFLVTGNASIEVPVRGANTDAREARDQEVGAPLAPGDHLPGLGRKRKRETLDGLGLVVGVAEHAARRAPTPGAGDARFRSAFGSLSPTETTLAGAQTFPDFDKKNPPQLAAVSSILLGKHLW